eukprot:gb/GEZJ01001767.1/.p1 GENE.gb/GEZJ01001767.1/~~gb/GEZJ01001767.1/.p1  ORF type:complete len:402 (-),score=45.89 gb/GEZJ01001767.1/:1076-2281(-)
MSNDSVGVDDHILHGTGICAIDPTQIFIPAAVLSDEHDFGTLLSATVHRSYVSQIGFANVSIRILSITAKEADALRAVVQRVKHNIRTPLILSYVGVWKNGSETWLVSERRRQVSVRVLFENIHFADPESIVSHIVNQALSCLRILHQDHLTSHLSVTHSNIYICHDASVCLGDVAVYSVLCASIKSRRSCSGAKLWPMPRNLSISYRRAIHSEDVWDLGISILTLMDGSATVARGWRSGKRVPHLANANKWSAQLNSFLTVLFSQASIPPCAELLSHRFVANASSSACHAAVAEYFERCADLIAEPYRQDIISTLCLKNEVAIQAPLISIDDYSTDLFSCDQWNSVDADRATVELSLARMLANFNQKPLCVDIEKNKCAQRTVGAMQTFLETADAEWNRM